MEKNNLLANIKPYMVLHILLLLYSLGGICSKYAGQADFLSVNFFIFYGLVLLDLGVYAIVWQQVLRKLPLVTAYANKAITVVWGLVLGKLVFKEQISVWNIIGAIIIITGIYLVVKSDEN